GSKSALFAPAVLTCGAPTAGAGAPTSRLSRPICVHLPQQLLGVLDTRHNTDHSAGGRPAIQLVLLELRWLATGSLDLQRQRSTPINPDDIRQPPAVRAAVGLDHVRALSAQPAQDRLGDRCFGHAITSGVGTVGTVGTKVGPSKTALQAGFRSLFPLFLLSERKTLRIRATYTHM